MSSISSILFDQLESYGIPLQHASKVTGMFTGDIVTLALRLACVSLLTGFVRGWFHHWRDYLHEGKHNAIIDIPNFQYSSPPHISQTLYVYGPALTLLRMPTYSDSSSTTDSSAIKTANTVSPRRTKRGSISRKILMSRTAFLQESCRLMVCSPYPPYFWKVSDSNRSNSSHHDQWEMDVADQVWLRLRWSGWWRSLPSNVS